MGDTFRKHFCIKTRHKCRKCGCDEIMTVQVGVKTKENNNVLMWKVVCASPTCTEETKPHTYKSTALNDWKKKHSKGLMKRTLMKIRSLISHERVQQLCIYGSEVFAIALFMYFVSVPYWCLVEASTIGTISGLLIALVIRNSIVTLLERIAKKR